MSPSVKGKVSRNYTTLACENCKKSKTRCVQSFDVHIPISIESVSSRKDNKDNSYSNDNNNNLNGKVFQEQINPSDINNDKETKMEICETKMNMDEKDNNNIQEGNNQCNPHIIPPAFTSNPNINKNLNKNHITERPCCVRCNRRNLNCKYVPPVKKRGPKTRNSKMSVENLVTRDNVSV